MKKILKWVALVVGGCLLLGILNVLIQERYARWKVAELEKEFEANPAWVWAEPIPDEENGWPLWVEAAALLKTNMLEGELLEEELLRPMPSTPEGRRAALEKYGPVRELLMRSFARPRMRAPNIISGFTDDYSLGDFKPFLTLFVAEAMYCAEDGDAAGVMRAHDYYLKTLFRISDGGNKWATEWVSFMFFDFFSVLCGASDSPEMSEEDILLLVKHVPSEEEAVAGYRRVMGNLCEKYWWLFHDFDRFRLANVDVDLEWWESILMRVFFSEAELMRVYYGLLVDVSHCSLEELKQKYPKPDDDPSWERLLLAPRRALARGLIELNGFIYFKEVDRIRERRESTLAYLGVQAYHRRYGKYPKGLDDLVAEGILPVCPKLSKEDVEWVLRSGEFEDLTETSWTKRTEPREPERPTGRRRGGPVEE